jgi:hypothetical protein
MAGDLGLMVWCIFNAPIGDAPPISWVACNGSAFLAGSAVALLAAMGMATNTALAMISLMSINLTKFSSKQMDTV